MVTKKSQDDYKKTALRLPPELHESLHAAALASGRSYNAEIVARLEESFIHVQAPESAVFMIEQLASALENRSLMLSMRYDMVKLRQENLLNQIHRISAESALLAKEAKTDGDFARAEKKIEELNPLEEQAGTLQAEAEQIIRERDVVLEQIAAMRKAIAEGREKREAQLDGAKASSQATAEH